MLRSLGLVPLIVLLALALGPPAAQAGVADATCQGSVTGTFSPGLRLFAQNVTGTDVTTLSCVTLNGPTLRSASSTSTYTAVQSCLAPANTGTVTQTLRWSTGETSTFTANAVVTAVGGQAISTYTGEITAGLFAGDTAVEVIAAPAFDLLACASTGITSRTGTAVLTITSP